MDQRQNRYQRSRSRSWPRTVLIASLVTFFLLFCSVVGAATGVIVAFQDDLPSLSALEDYSSPKWNLPTKIYSRDGQLIASLFEERREIIEIKKLPPELIQAIIAIEDSRFYSHSGIDFTGIARAAVKNLMAGRIVEGGSTLTQQLAKVLFLSPRQTFRRKIKEALMALKIERNYTKKEILERYFNKIYFGEGAYGVETAAQIYFGKSAKNLNTAEAALLAALPKAPSYYSPIDNPEHAKRRHYIVLTLMKRKGMIPGVNINKLHQTFWNQFSQNLHELEKKRQRKFNRASYFAEYVKGQLIDQYGADVVYQGGLTVRTTVDLDYQSHLQKQLYNYLLKFNKEQGNLPDTATAIPEKNLSPFVEGSVALKDPQTGEMLALVGGHEFHVNNQLNRAVQSHRQPGSAFKPVLYTAALDNGYTVASPLQDRPLVFNTPQGQWTPQNYSKEFHGQVTLRTALVNSLNVASVDLMQKIGPETFIEYARKLGIESSLTPHMSLALGGLGKGVSLTEVVNMYSVFANKGIRTNPVFIREIRDRQGNLLERNFPFKREVINRQTAFLITSLLQDVVERGTGQIVGDYYDRPIAGKTGTTNEYRDAWFIGFTPGLVMGTWFGYDDSNRTLGNGMSGGVVAGRFWRDAAEKILENRPPKTFSVPPGITYETIDPTTGYLSTPQCPKTAREPFRIGQEPTRRCPIHTTQGWT
jgi:penicillin-binding protein 1A